MEPDPRTERLRRAVDDAIRKRRRREVDLAEREGPSRPGDVLGPAAGRFAVDWAVIQSHPDDGRLLFVVPADPFPLHGTSDVVVPGHASCAPLTLRCGLGMWARRDYFAEGQRVGVLDVSTLRAAQRKLADMVRGRVEGTAAAREQEADPQYEEWIEQVKAARAALESSLENHGLVLGMDEFKPGTPERLPCGDAPSEAHWYGPLEVSADAPGEIYLRADETGVRALWTGQGGPPPVRLVEAARPSRREKWSAASDDPDCESTPLLPWPDQGPLELRIGPGKGHRVAIDREQSSPPAKRPSGWTPGCEVVAIEFPRPSDGASDRPMFAGRAMAASRAFAGSKPPPATAASGDRKDIPRGTLRPEEPLEFALLGGLIRARVGVTQESMLRVSFETREPGLAGRTIRIALRDEDRGLEVPAGEVTLEPARKGPPPWWGVRECEPKLDPPFEIAVHLEPGGE